ncbi:YkvA family protein [Cytobacillus firmus]|uniref:YkvA family protein n=1 Tax=Cytobacillus firmus TaxID=1399 RepID=UPI0018CCD528|nr:YkvA family protein [Cytobacillus firmus]MBG9589473.1 methyltransferase type 11 [Cytobacillus firmus]
MPEIETKDYKDGYKKFSSRAQRYADDPEKTKGLLKKAALKAEKNKSSLSDIWEKFQLLIDLVKAWSKGDYRHISKKSIIFIIASILYFVSPIDLVPDFLIGMGILDDAAVLGFAVSQITGEIEKFKTWRESRTIEMK